MTLRLTKSSSIHDGVTPEFALVVAIIATAHKDLDTKSRRDGAIKFFKSEWYSILYSYCSYFVDAGYLEALQPPEGIINGN